MMRVRGPLGGEVPITGVLGDQQAATVGQVCFAAGRGQEHLRHGQLHAAQHRRAAGAQPAGLLTTVAYQFAGERPVYALEGSIAVTGSAVQWLRDQLGIIGGAAAERGARGPGGGQRAASTSCRPSPGCSRPTGAPTPAARSSGCRASTARRTSPGRRWSRSATRAATSSRRMAQDSGVTLDVLRVDGGVTANALCMQLQADMLGVPVSRPAVAETTALGAAYAAGLAVGLLARHRRAAGQLDRGPALGADLGRRAPRGRLPRLEEGGRQRTLDWVDVD